MANPYDFQITDTSPTIIYHPTREGEDLGSSWKSFYSNSPDSSYDSTHQNSNLASGTSLHSTTMQGASFEISFMGTAIQVYGSGTAGAYTTKMDSKGAVDGNPSNGMLASYTDLEYKAHTLSLNVTQSQSLNVTFARLTVGVGDKGATVKETRVDAVKVNSDGSSYLNNDYLYTTGQGTFNTFHDASNYPRVDTNNAGSTINFRGTGMSAVFVYGTINYDHGTYSVALSPSAGVSGSTRTFNATSKWFAYDQLIYWESGLDRSQTYTIALTNLDEGMYVDIHEVRWLEGVPGTSQNNGLSTAVIAGIAVGAIIGAVGIASLLFFFWRRRKNQDDYDGPTPATYSGQAHAMQKYPAHSQPLLGAYIEPFVLPPTTTRPYSDNTTTTSGTGRHSKLQSLSSSVSSSHAPHPSDSSAFQPYAGYGHPYSTPWGEQAASSSQLSQPMSGSGSGSGSHSAGRPPSSSGKGLPEPPRGARVVRQELDAGPVPIQDDHLQEEVLPPGYNPAWSSGRS